MRHLRHLLEGLDLWGILADLDVRLATFSDLGLLHELDDRSLWHFCQRDGWVLFTENRNDDGPNSLHATLSDSWEAGHLLVLTLSSKGRFEHDRPYGVRVATDVAEYLCGVIQFEYRDQPRIYVPR